MHEHGFTMSNHAFMPLADDYACSISLCLDEEASILLKQYTILKLLMSSF